MTELPFVDGFKLTISPTDEYDHIPPMDIITSLGFLPEWVFRGLQLGEDMETALTSRYQYYTGPMELPCTIQDDGCYTYPGDPIQHPVASVRGATETLYFYEHAFVAVVKEDGSTWFTRMD